MDQSTNRRRFLKACGLSALPLILPLGSVNAMDRNESDEDQPLVNFISDGLFLSPTDYLNKLQEINKSKAIKPDFYGNGGVVKQLEDKFAKLTGKEKAIYLPSGTMANQVAVKLLNENNTKAIVPENSHIFRDEADAAQSVHGIRLIPTGNNKPYFDLTDLKSTINYLDTSEVFKSGLGTIVIENPVRRADGTVIPLNTIKEITNYCRQNGYKTHLDGARLHIAAAYSNASLIDYSSCFDTVYTSLYKYLNAAGGAILCGQTKLIDQVAHQIKILGGTVYQNWTNAAVALHYLETIEEKWTKIVAASFKLIADLNEIDGLNISSITNGSNIYKLQLPEKVNLKLLGEYLHKEHKIWLGRPDKAGIIKFTINESILTRSIDEITLALKTGIKKAMR